MTIRPWLRALAVACVVLAPFGAGAQSYPTGRITLVVGFAAGGFADTFARLVGQRLNEKWNVPAVVENRAGAGGNLAAGYVAQAAPDGYTVLVTTTAIAINETLYSKRPYELAQLVPVAVPVSSPEGIATHPSKPRELKSFLASLAGKDVTVGTAGVGSGSHLAAEYFLKVLAKARAVHVPFRGGAPAVQAAIGNQVDIVATSFGLVPHVAEEKLIGLGVASRTRLEAMSNVPTFVEAGFPFEAESWVGFFVPRGTPDTAVQALNGAVNELVADAQTRQKLIAQGYLIHGRNVPDAQAYVRAEVPKWAEMVKVVGVQVD